MVVCLLECTLTSLCNNLSSEKCFACKANGSGGIGGEVESM